jgi:hypothetical protein
MPVIALRPSHKLTAIARTWRYYGSMTVLVAVTASLALFALSTCDNSMFLH